MYDALYIRISLEHLSMDESFGVAFLRMRIHWSASIDVIVDQVLFSLYQSWWHVAAHDVHIWFLWMAYGDMSKPIHSFVEMQNVVCCD